MTYQGRGPVRPWAEISLSANQTTNLAEDNHVEWDLIQGMGHTGLISLSTGAGQLDGLITLAAGRIYVVYGYLGAQVDEGNISIRWRDHSNDSVLISMEGVGSRSLLTNDPGSVTDNCPTMCECIVLDCRTAGKTIKLDVQTIGSGAIAYWRARSRVVIEVLL